MQDCTSLHRLATYCFGDTEHRLVRIDLKQEVPLEEPTTTTAIRPRRAARATSLPGPGKAFRAYAATPKDVQREAQFSDLMLIRDDTFPLLQRERAAAPPASSRQLPCPIVVVPGELERIEQIMIVDDGSASTFQRIKRVACLFSRLCSFTVTTLLIARSQGEHVPTQDEKLWINYLKLHFAQLAVHRVEENFLHTLPTTVDYSKNALIVLPTSPLPGRLGEVLDPLTQFKLFL